LHKEKKNKTYLPSIARYGYSYSKNYVGTRCVTTINKNEHEQTIIDIINKMYWGCEIKKLEYLLTLLTGETQNIFNKSNVNEKIKHIEYGNMCFVDIAHFLNSIEVYRRNNKWTGLSISQLINDEP